jgi:hypothetical protein
VGTDNSPPWPPPHLALPNLDDLDQIDRGEAEPPPECEQPANMKPSARLVWPYGVVPDSARAAHG